MRNKICLAGQIISGTMCAICFFLLITVDVDRSDWWKIMVVCAACTIVSFVFLIIFSYMDTIEYSFHYRKRMIRKYVSAFFTACKLQHKENRHTMKVARKYGYSYLSIIRIVLLKRCADKLAEEVDIYVK